MPLMQSVAGRYSATWTVPSGSPLDLGIMETGYDLSWMVSKDLIDKTDAYGQGCTVEGFYQGMNVFLAAIAKEWITGSVKASSPYNTPLNTGAGSFELGIIARADSGLAASIILTALAGTPAAASPTSLTAAGAILAESHEVKILYGPAHRTIPLKFRLYPYLSTTNKFFSFT